MKTTFVVYKHPFRNMYSLRLKRLASDENASLFVIRFIDKK